MTAGEPCEQFSTTVARVTDRLLQRLWPYTQTKLRLWFGTLRFGLGLWESIEVTAA